MNDACAVFFFGRLLIFVRLEYFGRKFHFILSTCKLQLTARAYYLYSL